MSVDLDPFYEGDPHIEDSIAQIPGPSGLEPGSQIIDSHQACQDSTCRMYAALGQLLIDFRMGLREEET